MSVENNNLLISLVKRASNVTEDFTTEAFVHLLRHLQQRESTIVQDLLKEICKSLREKQEKERQEIDLSKSLDVKILTSRHR